jgi:membrane-associated PAP2 superfamily phosphatase
MTDVYCPHQTVLFGGPFPNLGILQSYEPNLVRVKPGQCWPAGHASGGFALMGLMFFAAKSDCRMRLLLIIPGFTLSWVTGLFQMARGNHYLSHTSTSFGIALMVIWALEVIFEMSLKKPELRFK